MKSSIPTSKRQNGAPLMIFSEGLTKSNSVAPSEPEDLLLVTFDDSDDLSSESEKELDQPKFSGRIGPSLILTRMFMQEILSQPKVRLRS